MTSLVIAKTGASERRRQRIQTLEERLAEIERREREDAARKRRRAREGVPSSSHAVASDSEPALDSSHLAELESKINDLEADRVCLICFDKLRSVLFDCLHLVSCEDCATKLEICPMCRNFIVERKTVII